MRTGLFKKYQRKFILTPKDRVVVGPEVDAGVEAAALEDGLCFPEVDAGVEAAALEDGTCKIDNQN